MSASHLAPVLFVGGSGVVGSRAVRALRRLQPALPIAIGGRDLAKAQALAESIGHAHALALDLDQPGLGLPPGTHHSAVVTLMKDATLNTLRHAQAEGVPYLAFSDFIFDIGPLVGRFIHAPARAPLLLLGHLLGGTVVLATLHFAREFQQLHAIRIAGLVDEDDHGGPAGQADIGRLATETPRSLLVQQGSFRWVDGAEHLRGFTDAQGVERQGQPFPMLDLASLAAQTGAREIRVDFGARDRQRPEGRCTEVVIELEGELRRGGHARVRHELSDADVHAGISARGAAIAVERLLGLDGQPAPGPGLYQPDNLLDPEQAMRKLAELGVDIRPGQVA